jgi:hypothetical protein
MKVNIGGQFGRLRFLLASGCSLHVLTLYLLYGLKHIGYRGTYSGGFFSGNIGHWSRLFRKYKIQPRDILEIGSFRGDSARFLLDQFPNAQITCVDTWAEYDELKHVSFSEVEAQFNSLLATYSHRINKFKGRSNLFQFQRDKYDLIYIDGSHLADDVLLDLINSWSALKERGIIICDDYIWQFYERVRDNPCAAINCFLKLKKGEFRLLAVYRQIWIQKTAGDLAGT